MIALGNDVVDLKEVPKNGNHYYHRLASYALEVSERVFLERENLAAEDLLRTLWAIKESAYKSSIKLGNRDRFVPRAYVVSDLNILKGSITGLVESDFGDFHFSGKITSDFIHISTSMQGEKVETHEKLMSFKEMNDHSRSVRNFIRNSAPEQLDVVKDGDGIPWLVGGGKRVEVSLSHHGRFAAWATPS